MVVCAGFMAQAPNPQAPQVPQASGRVTVSAAPVPAKAAAKVRMYTPKDADVYCAGFYTDKAPVKDLFVVAGAEGGLKELFNERDTVFLSRGAGYIVNPGGEYILLRKTLDPLARVELFEGQQRMIQSLGTLYSEVGRLRINIVHEYVVTAEIMQACSEIQPGDIAVPLDKRPTPSGPMELFDKFAPRSTLNEGVIAAGKEFESTLGAGRTVYLNIGRDKGVEVGQLYRIYRTYATSSNDPNRRYLDQAPTHLFGMRQSYVLTKEQRDIMPRDILGEMVILSVHGKSATGLITISSAEIVPGDEVELKQ